MKQTTNIVILLSLLLQVFTSCEMKKELTGGLKPTEPGELPIDPAVVGVLDLKLKVTPEINTEETASKGDATASVNPDDFAVEIVDSTGTVVHHFDSYREYLNTDALLLKKGVYTVRATWGKLYEAAFDAPYFVGDTTCMIEPGVVSTISTNCSMQNAKVNVSYTEDFLKVFKDDFSTMVTNGTGILTMDKEEKRVAYFKKGGNLKFVVNATTHKGLDITTAHKINDINANALYNIVLGIDVDVDSIIDQVTKPGIVVDITMHRRDTIIEIEAPALPPEPEDPDDGPSEPEVPGGESITIVGTGIDSPVEMTEAEALSGSVPVRVTIKAPEGLTKVLVKIIAPELEALLGPENPFDLINTSPTMSGILDGVGLVRPKEGDPEYALDITVFMKMLGGAGSYKFEVTVTDKANKPLSKTLSVIIK